VEYSPQAQTEYEEKEEVANLRPKNTQQSLQQNEEGNIDL
jgi:hypothetical protein